jgi:hypothetical protein
MHVNGWKGRHDSAISGNCPRRKFADAINMDEDLEKLMREDPIADIKRLRRGIRNHRDCTGHERCSVPAVRLGPSLSVVCVRYRSPSTNKRLTLPEQKRIIAGEPF